MLHFVSQNKRKSWEQIFRQDFGQHQQSNFGPTFVIKFKLNYWATFWTRFGSKNSGKHFWKIYLRHILAKTFNFLIKFNKSGQIFAIFQAKLQPNIYAKNFAKFLTKSTKLQENHRINFWTKLGQILYNLKQNYSLVITKPR